MAAPGITNLSAMAPQQSAVAGRRFLRHLFHRHFSAAMAVTKRELLPAGFSRFSLLGMFSHACTP